MYTSPSPHGVLPRSSKRALNRLFGNRHAGDLAGAFGDLGTFLPLWLSMVVVCHLNPVTTLLFAGLANIVAGAVFKVPMAVQPMKAIAAIAIAAGLSAQSIATAGLIMGGLFVLLSLTGTLEKIATMVPKPVIVGVQWAVAVKLIWSGGKFLFTDQATQALLGAGYSLAAGVGIVTTILLVLARKTQLLSIVNLIAGVGFGLLFVNSQAAPQAHASITSSLFSLQHPFAPEVWQMVLPQLPMTLLNSVVAVSALGIALYPDNKHQLSTRRIGLSVGLINLITVPFGGMPVCHGSGGMAGQHACGARSGHSMLYLGTTKMAVALFMAGPFIALATIWPKTLLGIWVLAAGVELIRATWAKQPTAQKLVAVLVPVITICTGFLLIGVAVAWAIIIIQHKTAESASAREANR